MIFIVTTDFGKQLGYKPWTHTHLVQMSRNLPYTDTHFIVMGADGGDVTLHLAGPLTRAVGFPHITELAQSSDLHYCGLWKRRKILWKTCNKKILCVHIIWYVMIVGVMTQTCKILSCWSIPGGYEIKLLFIWGHRECAFQDLSVSRSSLST